MNNRIIVVIPPLLEPFQPGLGEPDTSVYDRIRSSVGISETIVLASGNCDQDFADWVVKRDFPIEINSVRVIDRLTRRIPRRVILVGQSDQVVKFSELLLSSDLCYEWYFPIEVWPDCCHSPNGTELLGLDAVIELKYQ